MTDEIRKVPVFETEAEEARWWDDNREWTQRRLLAAMKAGTTTRGTAQRLAECWAAEDATVRIPDSDLDLAKKQAEARGLPYRTYIQSVLHEALANRESRQAA